jgi:hypothetical protein
MKRSLSLLVLALVLLAAVAAFAADVTGNWTGTISGPNGDFTIDMTFKQDGTKLTGTVKGPQGDPSEISEGKVDGDKISFNTSFNGMTIMHEGVIKSDDEISLKVKSDQFPEMEMTLKRSK